MGFDWTSPGWNLRVVQLIPVNRDGQVVLVEVQVRFLAGAAMTIPLVHADTAVGAVE